jgi:hypothetical protein
VNQFGYGLNAGSIPSFIVAEMFPDLVWSIAQTLSASAYWTFTFVIIEMELGLSKVIKELRTLLVFAEISVFEMFEIHDLSKLVREFQNI